MTTANTPDDTEPDTIHAQWHDWQIYNRYQKQGRRNFKPWRLSIGPGPDGQEAFIPIVPVPSAGCGGCVSQTTHTPHGTQCYETPYCSGVVWKDARDPGAVAKYVMWRMSGDMD